LRTCPLRVKLNQIVTRTVERRLLIAVKNDSLFQHTVSKPNSPHFLS
jgi:hypothetical protein